MANMRVALLVARELLRCRLLDSGHNVLLLRVAELLDAASTGAEPFFFHTTTLGTGCRASRARRASRPDNRSIRGQRGSRSSRPGTRRDWSKPSR